MIATLDDGTLVDIKPGQRLTGLLFKSVTIEPQDTINPEWLQNVITRIVGEKAVRE